MNEEEMVSAAIDELIRKAKESGAILRTGDSAKRFLSEHPDSGISLRDVAKLISQQAIAAGVPIQFTSLE